MSQPPRDIEFETAFYENVYRRDPSYAEVIELLGGLYTQQGRIADGLRMDRRLVRLQPENATAHYNLACSLALMKRRADALRTLRRGIELGLVDQLATSDEYLLSRVADAHLYHVRFKPEDSWRSRLGRATADVVDRTVLTLLARVQALQLR